MKKNLSLELRSKKFFLSLGDKTRSSNMEFNAKIKTFSPEIPSEMAEEMISRRGERATFLAPLHYHHLEASSQF